MQHRCTLRNQTEHKTDMYKEEKANAMNYYVQRNPRSNSASQAAPSLDMMSQQEGETVLVNQYSPLRMMHESLNIQAVLGTAYAFREMQVNQHSSRRQNKVASTDSKAINQEQTDARHSSHHTNLLTAPLEIVSMDRCFQEHVGHHVVGTAVLKSYVSKLQLVAYKTVDRFNVL